MANLLYAVFIGRWHTMPTHYTKRTGWPTMQIIYTHAGKGVLNMDNQLYRLTPDTLCILDCRVYHYYYTDSPEGWDYSLGDNADQLSGGQLARIELARAILADRSILLLDEINASLDKKTSDQIHNYLLNSNLTFIEVIHHYEPADLKKYDQVIELN